MIAVIPIGYAVISSTAATKHFRFIWSLLGDPNWGEFDLPAAVPNHVASRCRGEPHGIRLRCDRIVTQLRIRGRGKQSCGQERCARYKKDRQLKKIRLWGEGGSNERQVAARAIVRGG